MGYDPAAHATVQNIQYEKPTLSDEGEAWPVKRLWVPIIDAWSPIYHDMLSPFNFGNYTSPRLPVDIGSVDLEPLKDCPRVLRTPIKPAGESEVRLPKELAPAADIVKRLMQYEAWVNPDLDNFHVHLTIDHGHVEPGKTQRFPGWHGDGLQGGQFKTKLVCEHSYIMATAPAVEVCMQPFFVEHVNEDRYNLFKEFDRQAMESNVYKARPDHAYLMDPYVVHRTPVIEEPTYRIFLRLTVANADLPIEYNTVNPMWEHEEYEDRIDIRDQITPPDVNIHWEHYGLAGKGAHGEFKGDSDER